MTEKEWLACGEPGPLLAHLGRKASERKLRLLAVAGCRRIERLLKGPKTRAALDVAERFADGLEDRKALAAARAGVKSATGAGLARRTLQHAAAYNVWSTTRDDIRAAALGVLEGTAWTASYRGGGAESKAVERQHAAVAALVRDVFGNPFRRPRLLRKWQTTNVVDLARTIYEGKAFDRMPVLADALMDAGCADGRILAHCGGDGPHVRGCWVLDLILGKG